jgi:hypothetical protein
MAFCTVAEFFVLVLCCLHCVLRLTYWFAFWHFVLLLASCIAFDVLVCALAFCVTSDILCCVWRIGMRFGILCCFWRLVLLLKCRARICKLLWSPGIDSLESGPGLLNCLQIRALVCDAFAPLILLYFLHLFCFTDSWDVCYGDYFIFKNFYMVPSWLIWFPNQPWYECIAKEKWKLYERIVTPCLLNCRYFTGLYLYFVYRMHLRKISLIEGNANSLRLKSDLERDFAVAVYLLESPSPTRL